MNRLRLIEARQGEQNQGLRTLLQAQQAGLVAGDVLARHPAGGSRRVPIH